MCRLYWLRARSHHSRATFRGSPPKSLLEATLLNPCVGSELHLRRRALLVRKHLPPPGPLRVPLILHTLPRSSLLPARWKEEDGEWGGLSNMTKVVLFLPEGGGGGGGRGLGVGAKLMGGCRRGKLVLMSRRSSGPPWTAPQPPNPGRPWS